MRLIDTTTYEVKEFVGDDVPPYAILSHTWGAEEVTLQDMIAGKFRDKAGFKKIELCCQQAKKTHFRYAWVDTCCIDKTSSAELSEAINSMFRWYGDSRVYYVYLSDTTGSLYAQSTPQTCSRWFMRGWTLQELLAPQIVEFYDRKWDEIGTKASLASEISSITSIQKSVLLNERKIRHFSVAQRFSWAARRHTTRVEDRAYSLLGLFSDNMSLLYGERENAFLRLQKKIVKTTNDSSILAWSRPLSKQQEESGEFKATGLLAESVDDFSNSQCVETGPLRNSGLKFGLSHVDIDLFTGGPYHQDCEGEVAFFECSINGRELCARLYKRDNHYFRHQQLTTTSNEVPLRWSKNILSGPASMRFSLGYTYQLKRTDQGVSGFPVVIASPHIIPTVNFYISADCHTSHFCARMQYLTNRKKGLKTQNLEQIPQTLTYVPLPRYIESFETLLKESLAEARISLSEAKSPSVIMANQPPIKEPLDDRGSLICIIGIQDQDRVVVKLIIGLIVDAHGPPGRLYIAQAHPNHRGYDQPVEPWKSQRYPTSSDELELSFTYESCNYNLVAKIRRRGCATHDRCDCQVHSVAISLTSLSEV